MNCGDRHPIYGAAAAQSPPTCATALTFLFGTLAQLRFGRSAVTVDDHTRAALGLPHVRSCHAGGSCAPILVDPSTGGGVRVGYDYPVSVHVPTLPRFGNSHVGAGVN